MSQPVSVITKAQELLESMGKEAAIKYFEDKIAENRPHKTEQDFFNESGYRTAIRYLKGDFEKKKK